MRVDDLVGRAGLRQPWRQNVGVDRVARAGHPSVRRDECSRWRGTEKRFVGLQAGTQAIGRGDGAVFGRGTLDIERGFKRNLRDLQGENIVVACRVVRPLVDGDRDVARAGGTDERHNGDRARVVGRGQDIRACCGADHVEPCVAVVRHADARAIEGERVGAAGIEPADDRDRGRGRAEALALAGRGELGRVAGRRIR